MHFIKIILLCFFLILSLVISSSAEEGKIVIRLEENKLKPGELFHPYPLSNYNGKIGLALAGGGSKGLAQIGILKVFEKEKIPVDFIAGTSMGGVIGGLYACGYSAEEIKKLVLEINWQDLFSDTPPRLSLLLSQREESEKYLFQVYFEGLKPSIPKALTSGQKLTNLFTQLTMQANFEAGSDFDKLKIPFRAVTTDLVSGQEIVLGKGDLSEALRATLDIPLIFTPVELEGKLLLDGGLVDPIPVQITRNMGADFVIAINTSSELLSSSQIKGPLDIANQSTSIMTLERKEQELKKADFVISPDLSSYSSIDFEKADELIEIGERIADSLISELKTLLSTSNGFSPDSFFSVSEIQITGNKILTDGFLKDVLKIRAGDKVSLSDIKSELRKLYSSGYLKEVYAELLKSSQDCFLTYHLIENPPFNRIDFLGNQLFSSKELQEKIPFPSQKVMNCRILQENLNQILKLYQNSGYSLAHFKKIEYDSLSGILKVQIDEGIISKIEFSGNKRTKNWMVTRNLPLTAGNPYNSRKIEKGLSNLYSTGLFEGIYLKVLSGNEKKEGKVLKLNLQEKKFTFLRGGAHYNDEYYTEGFVEFGDNNVFGIGNEIFTHLQYGNIKENYSLNFKADRIFKSYLTYKLNLYLKSEERRIYSEHKKTESFDEKRRGVLFSFGQQISRLGKASLEGKIERVETEFEKNDYQITSLTFRSIVDDLDKLPFPDKGRYHHLNFELAGKILGGDLNYRKFFSSIESYFPLGSKLNFHPKVAIAFSDGPLPLSEKFTLGGFGTLGGFYDQELKGDKLFYFNLGLRYKFLKRWYFT
ncbi:MAG: patatin-like phospholipase family protein, partial [candidate division Zixibacteria bacterium]|nr:patatin-like phospholipase family protein [candidate division Zixibacteria bacterium]